MSSFNERCQDHLSLKHDITTLALAKVCMWRTLAQPHSAYKNFVAPHPLFIFFLFFSFLIISRGLHWPYVNQYRSSVKVRLAEGYSCWFLTQWVSFRSRLRRVTFVLLFPLQYMAGLGLFLLKSSMRHSCGGGVIYLFILGALDVGVLMGTLTSLT